MSKEKSQESESVTIEKERQKTKRLIIRLAFVIVMLIVGGFIVYKGTDGGGKGSLVIDPSGKVELSLEKPVLEQVPVQKASYTADDKTVSFTTGKINTSVITELKASSHEDIVPDKFTGENLINEQAGFLLTVKNPKRWQVSYNSTGLTSQLIPVNMISEPQGSNLNVVIEKLMQPMDIRTYTTLSIQNMLQMGLIGQMPEVSYDDDSQTSFVYLSHSAQNMSQYQKIVFKNKTTAYIVTGTYTTSDKEVVNELTEMIGSFTLIGS